jgi:ribonuclease PH
VRSGELRADIDVDAAAEMLVASLWGLFYAGFVGSQERLAAITDHFLQLLDAGPGRTRTECRSPVMSATAPHSLAKFFGSMAID